MSTPKTTAVEEATCPGEGHSMSLTSSNTACTLTPARGLSLRRPARATVGSSTSLPGSPETSPPSLNSASTTPSGSSSPLSPHAHAATPAARRRARAPAGRRRRRAHARARARPLADARAHRHRAGAMTGAPRAATGGALWHFPSRLAVRRDPRALHTQDKMWIPNDTADNKSIPTTHGILDPETRSVLPRRRVARRGNPPATRGVWRGTPVRAASPSKASRGARM